MKTFTVTNATTLDAARAALANGKAAVIAGGTDLISTLKSMCSPTGYDTLVNIKTISGLSGIKEEGGMLKVGALTTLTEIAKNETVKSKYTALAEAARAVATPELRNMGTIAGNICQQNRCWYFRAEDNLFNCARKPGGGQCFALTGDNRYHSIFGMVGACWAVSPSDIAPVLVAFGAKIVTNQKTWEVKDFFAVTGERQVAIAADEIVTEIQIPTPATGTKSAYRKYAIRKAFDFPIVGAAAVVTSSGSNVSAATIALGAVYNLPRLTTAGDTLVGKAIDNSSAEAAGVAAVAGANAMPFTENTTAVGNQYMIQLAKVMTKRAVLACK
ncbi:MAG: FAD binding domain-containing protein [Dehalococcoidia bacterium]|nr:FAD binding domain-containing protein [Dehalococcoidia bacterium]